VMIKPMACGMPVIAYCHGSIPEVIEDGGAGFVVDRIEDAITAAERISMLRRKHCRRSFEQRFSVSCMAEDYLEVRGAW